MFKLLGQAMGCLNLDIEISNANKVGHKLNVNALTLNCCVKNAFEDLDFPPCEIS